MAEKRTLTVTMMKRLQNACLFALVISMAACQSTPFADRIGFESPQAAIDSVTAALRADGMPQLSAILGPESEALLYSGDDVEDRIGRARFLELYDEQHTIEMLGDETGVLYIGELEWPFPIPIVRSQEAWFFDTEEGIEELLDRRVGRNELSAIKVCLALVDAQRDYAGSDLDGDGVLEYAQMIRSTSGMRDGLFWATAEGAPPSPLGELIAAAEEEGFSAEERRPAYHGYCYRLLTSQGPHAPGGAYDYLAGESMIGGFALVAYPVRYGDSGVMSFVVSHDETVYQKDQGPDGQAAALNMPGFDPDDSWTRVDSE